MYGYGFLSRGFTDRREILHSGSATSQTGLLLFWGIVPGMAEFRASSGVMWRDMLLAEALVLSDCLTDRSSSFCIYMRMRCATADDLNTAVELNRMPEQGMGHSK